MNYFLLLICVLEAIALIYLLIELLLIQKKFREYAQQIERLKSNYLLLQEIAAGLNSEIQELRKS